MTISRYARYFGGPLRVLMATAGALLFLTLLALGSGAPSAAYAQNTTPSRVLNERLVGFPDSTPGVTFATTAYADLALATVTFNPYVDPTVPYQGAGYDNKVDYIVVDFSADATKATATTGVCAIFANGAIVTKTERYIASSAGRGTIGGTFVIPNTLATSQAVKVQCKSGDTNVFTVTNAQLVVRERW